MSQIKGLSDLPTELLLKIFDYLDAEEICSLLGTCTHFKDIVENYDQLISKLTLYVQYPKNIEMFAATMKLTTTPYQNIKITRSTKYEKEQFKPEEVFASISPTITNLTINWNGYYLAMNDAIRVKTIEANIEPEPQAPGVRVSLNSNLALLRRNVAINRVPTFDVDLDEEEDDDFIYAFPLFAGNIGIIQSNQERTVTMHRFRAEVKSLFSEELVNILRAFSNVSTMQLSNVPNMEVPENLDPLQNLSSVRELSIKQCDLNLCSKVLKSCVNLEKLENIYPLHNFMLASQRDLFEIFLISLEKLKELSLENVKSFFRSTHPEVKFKLHTLKLKEVFFSDQLAAENFFSSQDQLVTLEMQIKNEFTHRYAQDLFPSVSYGNILKICK